jgi:hypothetical protein
MVSSHVGLLQNEVNKLIPGFWFNPDGNGWLTAKHSDPDLCHQYIAYFNEYLIT